MTVQYVTMYKWEVLEDGTREKFEGRLNALLWELSLSTKLGCPDIIMPGYLPLNMYDDKMEKQYTDAKKEYKLRQEKLSNLIELILNEIEYNKKINDEYLYELWISRIFELNWFDKSGCNNVLDQIKILYEALQEDSDVNPFNVEIDKQIINEEKGIKKLLNRFKKNIKGRKYISE